VQKVMAKEIALAMELPQHNRSQTWEKQSNG